MHQALAKVVLLEDNLEYVAGFFTSGFDGHVRGTVALSASGNLEDMSAVAIRLPGSSFSFCIHCFIEGHVPRMSHAAPCGASWKMLEVSGMPGEVLQIP